MQINHHRQKDLGFSNSFIRNEHFGNNTFSQYQQVRLSQKKAGPFCCFSKSKVPFSDFDDLSRGKLVPGRTSKRISYQKPAVQLGQQQRVHPNQGSSPKRPNELAYHRSSRDNLMLKDRRKNVDWTYRRENQIDDIVATVITWEALLPDGWREYAPKISKTIEKVYRRVRSLDLSDMDEKSCWQDESLYFQMKHYRISPHFMKQRNMNTGKDRKIRRKKVQLSSKPMHFSPPRVRSGTRGSSALHSNVLLEQKHQKQKHTIPGRQPKQQAKKRHKKRVKRRRAGTDSKHDLFESKHFDSSFDANLTLNFNNYRNWETAHVVSWLRILNFPQYCEIVRQKGINGDQLSDVSITYLVTELKMTLEHATHIFGALEGIKSGFTEHESVNSRLSSTIGQKFKFPLYDANIGRESMVFKKVDGIMVGPRLAIPPPFDKAKMTPASEGTSLYSANDSRNLYLEQSRKSSIRSINLEVKSNIADRIQITRGSAEQKNSLTNLIDDISLLMKSPVHEIEKGNDLAGFNDMTKNNSERSKEENSNGGGEETTIPSFGKNPSISSENMTYKIHSSSESLSERNIKNPKELIFGGIGISEKELFKIDKRSSNCRLRNQQRDQRESVTQSSLQSEGGNRRKSVTLKLKNLEAECISDKEGNVVTDMKKQSEYEVTSEKKQSKMSVKTEKDNLSLMKSLKSEVSSLNISKIESRSSNTSESFLPSVEIDLRKVSSPSLIVRMEQ
jgi:hypothetical protein